MSEEKKLGQECVYPYQMRIYRGGQSDIGEIDETNYGISKRFYAACAAMQGMLSTKTIIDGKEKLTPKSIVTAAYIFADELLKQENE